jgi:hypothetical protein
MLQSGKAKPKADLVSQLSTENVSNPVGLLSGVKENAPKPAESVEARRQKE